MMSPIVFVGVPLLGYKDALANAFGLPILASTGKMSISMGNIAFSDVP